MLEEVMTTSTFGGQGFRPGGRSKFSCSVHITSTFGGCLITSLIGDLLTL